MDGIENETRKSFELFQSLIEKFKHITELDKEGNPIRDIQQFND